jgi:hypothetical protein
MFVFGSWVCIADGAGNFRRFLIDMMPKTVAADPRSGLDKFVDELDNLPLHASAAQIEMESVPSSTSSGVATTSPGLTCSNLGIRMVGLNPVRANRPLIFVRPTRLDPSPC